MSDWRETGRFPPLILLGVALLLFFVATGIPQTMNSYQWKAGDVGFVRWMRGWEKSREADTVAPELLGTWRSGEESVLIERDRLTISSEGKARVWSRDTCTESFSFDFAYATGTTLGFHPSVYKYHDLLDGPPIPSLYASCNYRVYAFLKLADGRLLTLRDPHRDDVQIAFLKR